MKPRRRIPAIVGMALIFCGFLIACVHFAWPAGFDDLMEPFLPWTVDIGIKLSATVLAIGALILLIASTS